ncbi:MAG TPA: hypothetical protein VN618_06325 [Solirubrobacteraceae bacterium]|nr:hypothetical protein [Solirubrobacteraceae bacterium]
MGRFRSIASALTLLAFGVAAAAPAAAAAKTEKAQFKLVIEGSAIALRTFSVSGTAALCRENVSGDFTQHTEYLRGKGVVLDFVRSKAGKSYRYGIKRAGGKPDFTVVATVYREATGTASLTPTPGLPEPLAAAAASSCSQAGTDLSTTPGCKVKKTQRNEVGLKVSGNTFAVVPAGEAHPKPPEKPVCGETVDTRGFLQLDYEWPAAPPTKFEPFPDAKMFNPRINAVAVELSSGEVFGESKPLGTPPLTGTEKDTAANTATVRFIRCGERKRPAC